MKLPVTRIILPLSLFSTLCSSAQVVKEGDNTVSVGYGVGTFIGAFANAFDIYSEVTTSSMGPVYVKYEHMVTDKLGLGVNFAYTQNSWSYRYEGFDTNGNSVFYTETTDRTSYSVLARLNAHFGNEEKFDPYIGFGLGYRDANWEQTSNNPDGFSDVSLRGLMPLGMELTIGARYFFTPNIGLYAELGGAKSVVQGGLAVKF